MWSKDERRKKMNYNREIDKLIEKANRESLFCELMAKLITEKDFLDQEEVNRIKEHLSSLGYLKKEINVGYCLAKKYPNPDPLIMR